ncbi:MAG TPA: arginase [Ornithinibacter sp.]|jgi:arginase|uniref:arginase n=1 Tax=Ornithinibacter sp. TaxID=2862748 RepID=UPI001B5B3DD3|nr:arginase [Ornithinibacter sp.]MBP6525359.1 arginase [Dermatophilaceae bacterium]MBU9943544.1 arginase [Dermatophilaceae bacterium]HOB79040.1 arginase [Ornithinibacter sp.]HQA13199.1 arginase [Ornithinibacter sp.]HQD67637.1 arginase [Ornithinibacter sp.]
MDHISLIGAPTDVGASVLGCRMGPAALRLAGIQESLERFGSEVHDCGDVTGPDNPGAFAVDGYRHLAEVTAWNHAVFDAVYAELVGGRLPIMLGGDHCLAIGSISAAARHCRETGKRLRVLWFDAHADYNTASITPSGNMHGMPVAVLTGNGPEPLLNLSGAVPAVDPHDVREIGLRDVDLGEKHLLAEHEVEVFDMRYLDEIGVRHAMEMALKGVDENTHLHVSLDLDFLDDSIAPGVGTPVRGGPTYREAHLCMEMIADTGRLGSLDIVELNPALDVRSQTSTLAVDLVESLFGKSTLLRVHRR